jgi:EAL domain-containing protein (putative c-di-GMP-specific phosphodiesterase class I)/CheY-like chemotaxis protein
LAPTLNGTEVMARLHDLLSSSLDAPYRILIVEDDRSQALFAESILRKSSMDVLVVLEPFQTIAALEQYKPDLILMDLYMPGIDGIELTSIIRERDEFVSTPIVFLSGEQDSDKQYDAINAGGDDFLAKPIRPKHLISSVTNRARRARALRERKKSSARDTETGLFDRSFLIDRMTNALIAEDRSSVAGGLLLVEMSNVESIRLELGVDAVEQAMRKLARKIATLLQTNEFASRFGEASLGVLSLARDVTTIDAHLVRLLVDFDADLAIAPGWRTGCTRFENRLVDASQMLNAAHRQIAERSRATSVAKPAASAKQESMSSVAPNLTQSVQATAQSTSAHVASTKQGGAAISSASSDDTTEDFASAIRQAIRNDEFQVLFEPIVALQGGSDAQFELLLRYSPIDGEVISHSELHARASEHGLNSEIDRWLLNKALATLDERSRAGKALSKLFVSQSVDSLRDPSRLGWLRQSLDTRRITSTGLYLAFRMNDVVRELKHAIVFFQSARQQGIRIVLDQFESSLTTLQLLSYLPIDAVKLSSRYLDPTLNLRDELVTLVNAAHAGSKHVVAARVEDAKLASSLWSAGVDYIQGNFVQSAGRDMSFDFQSSVI